MKIVFNRQALINTMSPLMCAVGSRGTNPITEYLNVKTDAENGVVLTTYDLEKAVRTSTEGNVYEDGNYCVNAVKFLQTLKLMDGDDVTLEINDRLEAFVRSGRAHYKLCALSGDDFPVIPAVQTGEGFEISAKQLKKMIAKTEYAMGINDQRPVLNGAFFKIGGGELLIVACDSFKLAKCRAKVEIRTLSGKNDEFKYILPQRTVSELLKMLPDGDDDKVIFNLSHKNMICTFEGISFFSRLIEGEYIDYDRIILTTHRIHAVIDRNMLLSALERASVVTEEKVPGSTKPPITCEFEGNLLKLSASSSAGVSYDEIETEHEGEDITISFNNRNLMESIRACGSEKMRMDLSTPLNSVNIIPLGEEDGGEEVFFIMPVRTRR